MTGKRRARLWVIDALLMFMLVLWIIQLFLFITGLDAYLGGVHRLLWPAAIASLILAAVNLAFVRALRRD